MEQNLRWEAGSILDSEEIPRRLLNPEVHYRIYSRAWHWMFMNAFYEAHTFTPYLFKIQFYFAFKFTPPKWCLRSTILYAFAIYPCVLHIRAITSCFHLITLVTYAKQCSTDYEDLQ
jgi:hypothetical protein